MIQLAAWAVRDARGTVGSVYLAGLRIPDEDVHELAKRVCRARPTGINGSWMNRAQLHPDQAFQFLCRSRLAQI